MPRYSRWTNVDHLLGFDRRGHRRHDEYLGEETALLSQHHGRIDAAVPPKEVTKVCLRLRHLVQEILPYEVDVGLITDPNSRIITQDVLKAAKEAGGEEYKGCVVYCLLVVSSWFKQEADIELWNAGQHNVRAEACGVIAKFIIEAEEDTSYLLHSVLLHRYSHLVQGAPAPPTNVIEKAVDLHAVRVIGSSGYQKCIGYLWRGWVVQDEDDPSFFVDYTDKDNTNFFVHMDPNRMRTPRNQNAAQLLFSVVYLGLYTMAINTVNAGGVFDFAEILLYFFTLGYVCDELLKLYKVGYRILGFWNVFNAILYAFLTVSLAFRVVGLSFKESTDSRKYYSEVSYDILAFVAPMFWCRLLLYLDSFRFFGTMLVVLKVMLKESVIFFALLSFILIGFLQAFIGLDLAEDQRSTATSTIVTSMVKAVLANPELDGFATFSAPWGTILYYCYTFIVMTVLLNILIALYNSAYSDILSHADDEYLALFAQRTMQFVRAPDENVYVAPLNLVEIVISASSEWWVRKQWYESFNDCVMSVLYSPLLVVTAYLETRTATIIRLNRARGEDDDDVVNEWEQLENEVDFVAEGWSKTCDSVKPNLAEDPVISEIKFLRAEVEELKSLLAEKAKAADLEASVTIQGTQDAGHDSRGHDSKPTFSHEVIEPNQASEDNAPDAGTSEPPTLVLYPAAVEPETVVVETSTVKTGEEPSAGGAAVNTEEEQGAGEAVAEESEDSKQSKSKQKKKKKETGKSKDSTQADSSSSGRSI
ncbi:Calcium channel YVC1 [Escovopsis weberi]|uniref:Calcium channel YVC1 n=1 Tax=Escovopsis weberi TaxID=150374 RepID=A0A0N0RU62_ESCWE|nr:Calcium channel YVC1 [Escovopsis weberi]